METDVKDNSEMKLDFTETIAKPLDGDPIGSGGEKIVYLGEYVSTHKKGKLCVIKTLKKGNIYDKHCWDGHLNCIKKASELIDKWNQECKPKMKYYLVEPILAITTSNKFLKEFSPILKKFRKDYKTAFNDFKYDVDLLKKKSQNKNNDMYVTNLQNMLDQVYKTESNLKSEYIIKEKAFIEYILFLNNNDDSVLKQKMLDFIKKIKRNNIAPFGEYVCIEDYLYGKFIKWNSNSGWISDDIDSSIQSFCHWTYHYSNGKLLYCDAQGIRTPDSYILTDPCIVSNEENGLKYGLTDMGSDYLNNWFLNHKCNNCCESHWLIPSEIDRSLVSHQVKQQANRATTFNVTKYHKSSKQINKVRSDSIHVHNQDVIMPLKQGMEPPFKKNSNIFQYSDKSTINDQIICVLAMSINTPDCKFLKDMIKDNETIVHMDICQTRTILFKTKIVLVLTKNHFYLLDIIKKSKELQLKDTLVLRQIEGDIGINESSFCLNIKSKGKFTFTSLMSTPDKWKKWINKCRQK